MKRYLLIGLLPLLGILMTGCHDDEKEEDIPPGFDPTKIVFNEQGEPKVERPLSFSFSLPHPYSITISNWQQGSV